MDYNFKTDEKMKLKDVDDLTFKKENIRVRLVQNRKLERQR